MSNTAELTAVRSLMPETSVAKRASARYRRRLLPVTGMPSVTAPTHGHADQREPGDEHCPGVSLRYGNDGANKQTSKQGVTSCIMRFIFQPF